MASTEPSETKSSLLDNVEGWGKSSIPAMGMATLVSGLHLKPLARVPIFLFTPMLVFSAYLNVAGYKIDSAGMTAAWSGLYVLLAARRRPASLRSKFMSLRGVVRGAAMGLGGVNTVAGGYVYFMGNREAEAEERRERDRWGIEHALEEKKMKEKKD